MAYEVANGSQGSGAEEVAKRVLEAAPRGSVAASKALTAPRSSVRAGILTLPGSGVGLSLPSEIDTAEPEATDKGLLVYAGHGTGGASVAIAESLEGVTAVHTVIPGPTAPHAYRYRVLGATPDLNEDGSVSLFADSDVPAKAQQQLGLMAPPWAVDADGTPVPTHYEVRGPSVVQIVDFDPDTSFPVVADPSVKMCDWYSAWCVKFSKSETKAVNDAMFVSVAAGVNTLCGFIPLKGWGIAVRAACSALIAGVFYSMRSTFNSAKKAGRCVEVKWGIIGPIGIRGWKVVSC